MHILLYMPSVEMSFFLFDTEKKNIALDYEKPQTFLPKKHTSCLARLQISPFNNVTKCINASWCPKLLMIYLYQITTHNNQS